MSFVPRALVLALSLLAACGRLGFDPGGAGDAAGGTSTGDASGDAARPADALAADLVLWMPFATDDLARDRVTDETATCTDCPTAPTDGVGATFAPPVCLRVAARPELRAGQITIAFWLRVPSGFTGNIISFPFDGETTQANSWELYRSTSGPYALQFNARSASDTVVFATTSAGWHHVAAVRSDVVQALYIDGVPTLETNLSPPGVIEYLATDDLRIGCDWDYGAMVDGFRGDLDDLRIYARPFGDADVQALVAAGH